MIVETYGPVFRRLLVIGLIWLCATTAADAQIRRESDVHARLAKEPLRIFLARGGENACGKGCSTWIAVDGQFDKGSAERFVAFVRRLESPDLPVFFNSTGGLTDEGIDVGRFLRINKMRAGVASSRVDCASQKDSVCKAIMAAATPLPAIWSSNATCSSACVFALLGAPVRVVPDGVKIGVHSTAYFCFREDGRVMRPVGKSKDALDCKKKLQKRAEQLTNYITDMSVSKDLIRVMEGTPSSRIRFLTRDEIERYRIATTE